MDAEDNSHSSKRAHFKFYCSGSPRARGGDCSGPLLTCEMVWFRCKPSHPRAMPSPFLLFRPIFHFDRDNPSCHSKCHFYILGFKTGYLNWCGWKIILEGGGGGSCLLPFNCFISLLFTLHIPKVMKQLPAPTSSHGLWVEISGMSLNQWKTSANRYLESCERYDPLQTCVCFRSITGSLLLKVILCLLNI